MTITVWPVDAVSGAPSYTGRMLRQTHAVAFAGATSARPLGARSGVRPGTPSTTVTTTSTTFTIQPHAGLLDLETALQASAYAYSIDAAVTGSVTAANASNPRVDIIYVQLNDPAESDGSATPGLSGTYYLAGTAAASPVAPATPARAMVLAQLNVPTSGGGSPTVTWMAPYCAAAGGARPVNTLSQAGTGAYNGDPITTLDTGVCYWWDTTAAAWLSKPRQPPTACRYYRAAAFTLTAAGRTAITLDTRSFDYSAGQNLYAAGVFTAPEVGLYDVRWRVGAALNANPQEFHSLIATPAFAAELSYGTQTTMRGGTSGDLWASSGADFIPLASGGQFILAAGNGGGNALTGTVGAVATWLSVVKVD